MTLDETAGNRRTSPIKLAGAVARLADQYDPGIAVAIEQFTKRIGVQRRQRLAVLA